MKVVATKVGHYLKIRQVGDVFEWPDERKLARWMKKFDESERPKVKEKTTKTAPHALSEIRESSKSFEQLMKDETLKKPQ
jgi:hypothetical protein